jgi:hypothetical protein
VGRDAAYLTISKSAQQPFHIFLENRETHERCKEKKHMKTWRMIDDDDDAPADKFLARNGPWEKSVVLIDSKESPCKRSTAMTPTGASRVESSDYFPVPSMKTTQNSILGSCHGVSFRWTYAPSLIHEP